MQASRRMKTPSLNTRVHRWQPGGSTPWLLALALSAPLIGPMPGPQLPPAQAQEPPTYYVNAANANPVFPYTSWATAATNLQDAVNAGRAPGRLVLVTDGVYQTGSVQANGANRVAFTNAEVRSVNGPAVTIIDGGGAVRCVQLGTHAILSGLTLQNGKADKGGGVWAEVSAVMTNCVLKGNSATGGGGAFRGTLHNCRLIGNTAGYGAGADDCTLYNCAVTGNSSTWSGWSVSGGTLYNCTVTANSGGGVGGALLYNCTVTGNTGDGVAGGRSYNCIVYFNPDGNWSDGNFEYSCTTPLPPGPGNISSDPQLASATHVASASSCIGAGHRAYATGVDIDGEAWADPPAMGADQTWPGQGVGSLTVRIIPEHPGAVVPGWPLPFTADIAGSVQKSIWDFGDGTGLTNQPFAGHTWTTPGTYTVRLIGYNDSHPEGVTASREVAVMEAVFCVNVASANPVFPYTSWATAATNIQDAINASTVPGRTVLVTNGVYQTGSVEADGPTRVALTNMVLRSVNGPDVTIIDGGYRVRCAYVGPQALLSGFTLRHGQAGDRWGSGGAGVAGDASGVITNCVIRDNSTQWEGGGALGGTLYRCALIDNFGGFGGGGANGCTLYDCTLVDNYGANGGGAGESTLSRCTLTDNGAFRGGGAWSSTLDNCTLTDNAAIRAGGGACQSTLRNCTLTGNRTVGDESTYGRGGGAWESTLYNCTVTGNAAGEDGGAVSGGTLYNCIVYFNQGGNWSRATLAYCCTTPLPPGPGNISADPQLASVTSLSADSPCLGAGHPAYATGVDLDGEPWADPPAIGADQVWPGQSAGELTVRIAEPSTDLARDFSASFSAHTTGRVRASVWDFGDGTVLTNQAFGRHAWTQPGTYTVRLTAYNDSHPEGVTASLEFAVVEAIHYVNVANAGPVFPYTTWATAATNIQDAVNAGAVPGRLVLVTNGVYQTGAALAKGTNRVALTNVVLRSVNGPEVTVIDGAGTARGVYLEGDAILSGFTVRHGKADYYGGGVCGLQSALVTNCVLTSNTAGNGGGAYGATLRNCRLTANSAAGTDQGCGGGVAWGALHDCVLAGNSSEREGGGTWWSVPRNCTLTGNRAGWHGGGAFGGHLDACLLSTNTAALSGGGAAGAILFDCTLVGNSSLVGGGVNGGSLSRCTLTHNAATQLGGGAIGASLENCTLTGNAAEAGGGAHGGTLRNCLLTDNTATDKGGGAYGATLYNCTLTGNAAVNRGGGVWGGSLYNCIVCHNRALMAANWEGATIAHSCTTPLPPGLGNISDDPQLASPPHLFATSPCLGAGRHDWASGLDIDGEPWADPPAMGADEVWPGELVGPLTAHLEAGFTEVATGFPASFTARTTGALRSNVWDFGDGTLMTNRLSVAHTWTAPGTYTVRLTSYNDTHPDGVAAELEITAVEAVHYVNWTSPTPVYPYTSWATAARCIQDAVDAGTVKGRLVLVTNGLYKAGGALLGSWNRVLLGDALLRSVNGPAVTIIDGESAIRCVYLGTNAILDGFTLRNGRGSPGGGVVAVADGVVTNCILTGNTSDGAGGGAWGGILDHCTLTGNTASQYGGGASQSVLYDCTLTGNTASWAGSGAHVATLYRCALSGNAGDGASGSRLHNCTLTGNSGAGASGSTLYNCALSGNQGSGASDSRLYNCTLTGNAGGGVRGGSLYNCLVYFNGGTNWTNAAFEYSCTTPLPPGSGNISDDPQLASATHLSSASPCLGIGNAAYASGVDLDGEPWADPPAMGADQVWPGQTVRALTTRIAAELTQVAANWSVAFTAYITGPLLQSVWDFGDGTTATNRPFVSHAWTAPGTYTVRLTGYNDSHPDGVSSEVQIAVVEGLHYVNAANPTPVFPYTSWATAATNIQDAINAGTAPGRTVWVTNGVYQFADVQPEIPSLVTLTNVLLRSVNGPEVTTLDGAGVVRCVDLSTNALLGGFTVRNSSGDGVAAVTSGMVTNCVLTGNAGSGASGGTLDDCTLAGNLGSGASGATLHHCRLTGNLGSGANGGTVYDCTLTGNSSGGANGATLYNCSLTNNRGGGVNGGTLHNCALTANSGGGANGATLYNCTVTGNSGGGVNGGTLYNCIVYFNEGANWTGATFAYSCTTPRPNGLNNITADPQLASMTHLSATSPCLGAGSPAHATGLDLDGEPWADPPAMGADQVWPGQTFGPLTMQIHPPLTHVAIGFPAPLTVQHKGRITRSVWDFGDGMVVTNQPVISHAWSAPGTYTVRLTGYNDTHVEGVTTTLDVEVLEAVVHYVHGTNATPLLPYTTWATAATNLQDAINACVLTGGRLVLVTNGVYQTGSVEADGPTRVALTNVMLRSVNGPAVTIIDGGGAVRGAYLGTNAVLSGFTVRNGRTPGTLEDWRGFDGAGVFCEASGVVTNCVLTGNSAEGVEEGMWGSGGGGTGVSSGGGAYGGTLYDCTLADNSATRYGGGACDATLYNCTLTGNSAEGVSCAWWGWCHGASSGGAAYGGTLHNCTLADNSANLYGGGACDATLYNCVLTGNSADSGGGAYGGTLFNCTLTGNSGGGTDGSKLYNCIVCFNQNGNWTGATFEHSCATPLPPGPGNIAADPILASATHLSVTSPCIGAGNPAWATGVDLDGEPWADPPAMGADQVWPGQSMGPLTMHIAADFTEAGLGFPVPFMAYNAGPLLKSVWDFGDGTVATNQAFIRHAWTAPGPYTVRLTGYSDGHLEGVATELQIEVIEAVHYVDAANPTPAFPFTSWATAATNLQDAVNAGTLPGRLVRVTNGVYQTGSVEAESVNRVALTNIVLRSVNGPEVTVIDGAGEARCAYLGTNAILSGFILRNGSGGGVTAVASGVVTNCVLTGNAGGGANGGTLYHCALTGNSGGGANGSTLHNCAVSGNADGGANGSTLYNCALTGNTGRGANGSTLYNCTLTGNVDGGVNGGNLYNCIVYFNQGGNWANAAFEYSCTTPLPPGPGNIEADPRFMNAAGGDYRLRYGSPCIDTGAAPEPPVTHDLDGLPRPLDGDGDGLAVPDMGAYEFDLRTVVPVAWFTQHNLDASDPYALSANPDEDGQTSFQEWLTGTDPRDPLSFFRIEAVDAGPPVKVFYQGLTGRAYSLYTASELGGASGGTTLWAPVLGQANLPGSGGLDSLTDTNALARAFYRVAVSAAFPAGGAPDPTEVRLEQRIGESVVFIGEEVATLAHPPVAGPPLSVRNTYLLASDSLVYVEERDYVVDYAAGTLRRTSDSRLPDFRNNVLFGQEDFDASQFPGFGNSGYFAFVDYVYALTATWPVQERQTDFLRSTLAKLEAGGAVRIVAYGDSITVGSGASKPELIFWRRWADALQRKYPTARVAAVNSATSSDCTVRGLQRLQTKVLDEQPDLVLVAFGMNDHNIGRVPIPQFQENLRQMIACIRAGTAAEVVLLSAFPPNPKWRFGSHRMADYAEATRQVARDAACAYADVFTNWQALAARKKPEDMLANNFNHPNDFGHWIYFRVLDALGL